MLPDQIWQIFKHPAAFQQLVKVDEKVLRDRDLKSLGGSNLRCIFEAGSEGLGAAGTFNGFLWAEQPLSSEGLTKESKNWGRGKKQAGRCYTVEVKEWMSGMGRGNSTHILYQSQCYRSTF